MSHLTPSSQSCLPNTHKELECLSFPRCLIPDNRVWLSEQGPSPHKDTHVSTQKLWIHCITWKLTLLIYWPWDEKMTSIWGWFVLTQYNHKFSSVQLLSRVQIFATPWTAAHQASLLITNSWSLLRLVSIESVSSPSPPAPNPSQHQSLFQWVNSSHEVTKVLEFQLQHQSFQWIPRTDLL